MGQKLPFNITLIDPSKARLGTLLPVTVLDIHNSEGDFHPQGLYSSQIFGRPGDHTRQTRHGYIDMHTRVLHPKVYLELTRLKNLYKGIMAGTAYAVWDDEKKDFEKSDILDGSTGYAFFMSHYKDLVFARNDSSIRDLRIDLLDKFRDKSLYRYLIVMPAGLREIETDEHGRTVENEINKIYRKVIRVANTIAAESSDKNDPTLDTARMNLQKYFNEIYAFIENLVSGKRGFLLSKWGSRNVHGGTRNVITAMDPAPRELGANDALTVNDTVVGLHQFMKGTVPLTINGLRTGPLSPILDVLPNNIPVVDKDTWKQRYIDPSLFIRDKWTSEDSIEELINGFAKIDNRHKPVVFDGHYAALVYNDGKFIKVFYDIDSIPEDKDRTYVRPMTWAELYYLSVVGFVGRTVGFVTRYPVSGTGSIYPTNIYLKTTEVGMKLAPLDNEWKPLPDSAKLMEFPRYQDPFVESMSVHPSKVPGLNADYDGDTTSLNIVVSDEAVAEGKKFLNSPDAFLAPTGGLNFGLNNAIGDLVLYNFTGGLE